MFSALNSQLVNIFYTHNLVPTSLLVPWAIDEAADFLKESRVSAAPEWGRRPSQHGDSLEGRGVPVSGWKGWSWCTLCVTVTAPSPRNFGRRQDVTPFTACCPAHGVCRWCGETFENEFSCKIKLTTSHRKFCKVERGSDLGLGLSTIVRYTWYHLYIGFPMNHL